MLRLPPAERTAPAMLPMPANRTVSASGSTSATATAAPRVPLKAPCTRSSTSAAGSAARSGSRNVRTAADEADAAIGPWPEPSATIRLKPRPCDRAA